MILCVLILLTLDISLYSYRFVSFNTTTNNFTSASKQQLSSSYRNLILPLLILSFLIIFDFFFIILLPSEFFEVQLLTKQRMKLACRFVSIIHCCFFNISFYVYKRIACLVLVILTYLNLHPCEMLALWYFLMRLFLCPDIHPNPGPTKSFF